MTQSIRLVRAMFGCILGFCLFAGSVLFIGSVRVHAQEANGIASPYSGTTLHGTVDVTGRADHATFRKWQLDLLIDGDPKQATFLAVSEEAAPHRMSLATVDTHRYPNGRHVLRLRVVHSNLNYDEYMTPVVIGNQGDPGSIPSLAAVESDKPRPAHEQTIKSTAAVPAPKVNSVQFVPPEDGRWIEVDISDQTLRAWQGEQLIMETLISSGRSQTPTVAGVFSVQRKVDSQRMVGPGYNLPNVTSVMYFYSNYAIHAAYWHDNFGQVMSHGCVNMRVDEAASLYAWADLGTPVYVHD